jgi:hypothetical protein
MRKMQKKNYENTLGKPLGFGCMHERKIFF